MPNPDKPGNNQPEVQWEALAPAEKQKSPTVEWEKGKKTVDTQAADTAKKTTQATSFEPLPEPDTESAKPPKVEWIGGVPEKKDK